MPNNSGLNEHAPIVGCEPVHLNLGRVPLFGETVFRIKTSIRRPVIVQLLDEHGNSFEYPLVREQGNVYYAALKLESGTYYYRFLADGRPVPDPMSTAPTAVLHGNLVNRVTVTAGQSGLKIGNNSAENLAIGIEAHPRIVECRPNRITIAGSEHADILVSACYEALFPGPNAADIILRNERDGTIVGRCGVTLIAGSTVPSLNVQGYVSPDGETHGLKVEVKGTGTIRCRILDRIVPDIETVDFSCNHHWGWTEKLYLSSECSSEKAAALKEVPVFVVFSDSPFPEQRYREFGFA